MSLRLAEKFLLLALGLQVVSTYASDTNAPTATTEPPVIPAVPSTSSVRTPLVPGPADGRIGFVTARMLEQLHYRKQPFDDSVSGKFLDRYLESLDPQHMHFTQADLADFERYRTNLDQLTITRHGRADVSAATEIFNRFYERLQARVAYAEELLRNEQFTFDADERILINRKDAPYPESLEAAKQFWRERLRFEYLQEKLGKVATRKKPEPKAIEKKPGEKPKTEPEEIVDTLSHRYQRNLKLFRDFDSDDVMQVYLTALAHVYDPHSDYLGHSQLESFAIGMNLSLFGIGAELRSEDGYCTINRLLPGGPAVKSNKIKEKDRIVAVAQSNQPPVDVIDMNLTKAVQLIRGPKGTEVRLTVIPAGTDASSKKVVSLIRDEIPLEDQAAKAKLIEVPQGSREPLRVGIIDLPSFYATFDIAAKSRGKAEPKSTTADVGKLIEKLKRERVSGIILDLRRNGGGSLEEAIKMTGAFIKKGPVVQVRDSEGGVQVDNDEDSSIFYDGPLVVLTSRFSASASEILAGALQDYGRAIVVGDSSTHGKGTVQSVNQLAPYMQMFNRSMTNDPGALKVTIKKFYRASGASTQLRGVVPDIVLPSVISESKDFGESSLENPLPWDTIQSAKYEHLDRVAPFLGDLRRQSTNRVATDPEFAYIREDIDIFKKQQEDKTISLNEKTRLKEKEEIDARQKRRDKERLARGEPDQKVYEITLKLADKPGLPPPVEKTNTLAKADSAAGGSNSLANLASVSVDPVGDPADLEEEKPPAVDGTLLEAQRILADYILLLSKNNIAATTTAAPNRE
jgi:carboxyl-terminal processing protease